MRKGAPAHKRNLFEIDNARNLSMHELVDTFIPTQSFWRLLSGKHHVLLGARGHGKTAVAKMLSFNHLAQLANKRGERRAKSAIENQEFIGIYLPTRLEWVGGLRNKPWFNDGEREALFQWRLNIASCIAFLPIAKSCISTYIEGRANQAKLEKEITHRLTEMWDLETETNQKFDDLLQLRHFLEDIEFRKQIQILKHRVSAETSSNEVPVGITFDMDLFLPLRQGIKQVSRVLSIKEDCSWLLCIDEAEFLKKEDHRVINSYMRAYPENLFIKLTTMPYCHYTLETNIGADLVNGHDFEYVNMDTDRVLSARVNGETDYLGTMFGRTLFKKIYEASDPLIEAKSGALSTAEVLGKSEILDPQREEWGLDSANMKLLEEYATEGTVKRAHRLLNNPSRFRDEISRKIQGALLLREEIDGLEGNKALTIYSGARMAIRCSDSNPRRLIRIFNALTMHLPRQQKRLARKIDGVSPKDQTRILRSLSASTLSQVRSFPEVGPELHKFLTQMGEYMKSSLLDKPLSTDQVSSIKIDDKISDKDWKLVQEAVGQGLLYPNIGPGNTDEMPWREGTFRLAYVFSPHFLLLPRRGKAVKIATIRRASSANKHSRLKANIQPTLFGDGAFS